MGLASVRLGSEVLGVEDVFEVLVRVERAFSEYLLLRAEVALLADAGNFAAGVIALRWQQEVLRWGLHLVHLFFKQKQVGLRRLLAFVFLKTLGVVPHPSVFGSKVLSCFFFDSRTTDHSQPRVHLRLRFLF